MQIKNAAMPKTLNFNDLFDDCKRIALWNSEKYMLDFLEFKFEVKFDLVSKEVYVSAVSINDSPNFNF